MESWGKAIFLSCSRTPSSMTGVLYSTFFTKHPYASVDTTTIKWDHGKMRSFSQKLDWEYTVRHSESSFESSRQLEASQRFSPLSVYTVNQVWNNSISVHIAQKCCCISRNLMVILAFDIKNVIGLNENYLKNTGNRVVFRNVSSN